tara:strand:+ start:76 stop:1197 length:1122 start_codon:yes stop_codon:yes gene_type:complete
MTLVRKELYQSLIASRDEQLAKIEAAKTKFKELTDELKVEQKFVDNFDKTQADLADSITQLESEITRLEELVAKTKNDMESTDAQIEKAQSELDEAQNTANAEKDKLKELEKEGGTADQIAAQQQKVDKAEAVVSSLQEYINASKAKQESREALINSSKVQIETNTKAVSESKKQIEDNKEREKNSADVIPALETNIADLTSTIAALEAEYADFLAKNQSTIDNFEDQQYRRDANIPKEDETRVFFRQPANISVINEANVVMKGVIDDELNATDPEKSERSKWVEAGRAKDLNPYYLNASEAADLALANTWSTKVVAQKIYEEASKGNFEASFGALPNTVVYALQAAGYKIQMTDAALAQAEIIVSWQNLDES